VLEEERMNRYSLVDDEKSYDRRFHEMWTFTVGKPGYIKELWRRFDVRLERAKTKIELDQILQDASVLSGLPYRSGRQEKLIRHLIPEIARRRGESLETRTADDSEMMSLLNDKIQEEAQEFSEAVTSHNIAKMREEAADLRAVVDAIFYNLGDLETSAIATKKATEKGIFHHGTVLKIKS
jgi:predicted house-cleaning noncanonical NTP pyrophosphatase (MazG superfamily)